MFRAAYLTVEGNPKKNISETELLGEIWMIKTRFSFLG